MATIGRFPPPYDLAHASQSSTFSGRITANPAVEVRLDTIASDAPHGQRERNSITIKTIPFSPSETP